LRANECDNAPEGGEAGLLVFYCKRLVTRRLVEYTDMSGAWFMFFDKEKVPEQLQFDTQPDPGCLIANQLLDRGILATLMHGDDCMPRHFGIDYPMGVHLFWTRHLHDDPKIRISGFPLGDIQKKHDKAVDTWVRKMPKEYKAILVKRFGKEILHAKDWAKKCHT
jgi:hypothetical protein